MKLTKRITVLIVDDHMIVREGLISLLKSESTIEVIGDAADGRQAVALALELHPDVIAMDIAMPQMNGLEATRQILKAAPETKVIILSAHSDDAYVEHLTSLGVKGYLIKQTSAYYLAEAIREVYQGKTYFSPTIAARFESRRQDSLGRKGLPKSSGATLSSREREVLQLIAEGDANKQIAAKLTISIKTVEKHRGRLMRKLDIHDTAGLTRFAMTTGIIESNVRLPIA